MMQYHCPDSPEDFVPSNEKEYMWTLDRDQLLEHYIMKDDKDNFVSMLRDNFENGSNMIRCNIIQEVNEFDAINCAAALLQGEAGFRVDLNVPFSYGSYPLHQAANKFSVALIQLYLSHGARTDVRTNGADFIYNGLLPLNMALEQLCCHDYLKDWTPKDSIFKLITILCLPQMKVPLEATRLLALHTKETTEEFFLYAKDGYPLQIAVLLMVARDVVLAPFHSQDKKTLTGIMSIRRRIKKEIANLAQEEADLEVKGKGRNSTPVRMVKDNKAGLFSVLILLDVFEKAGDAIDAYLRLDPTHKLSKDKVVEDVKSILVKAGFDLKKRDTDLTKIRWDTYDGWICDSQLASEKCERTTEEISPPLGQYLPLQSQPEGFIGKQSIYNVHEQRWAFNSFFCGWTPTLSPKIDLGRPYSTLPLPTRFTNQKALEAQVKKRNKPIQQFLPKLPKSKRYATIAYSLAKATKRV